MLRQPQKRKTDVQKTRREEHNEVSGNDETKAESEANGGSGLLLYCEEDEERSLVLEVASQRERSA